MNYKQMLSLSCLTAALLASSGGAFAGVVAIVNKANTDASKAKIGDLYTGAAKTWNNGNKPKLFDLANDGERESFCKSYTGKSEGAVKAIWAQAVFSGQGVPPKVLESDSEVKAEVAKDVNAVGYINESSVDGSVQAIK